ncbi:MAG: SDR family oxidoreductase [Desulfobacterales bacterium]|nr:SDR family oxidoreductase [Desulfobacterales bacterium]
MKILMTGATSFIGKHILPFLDISDHEVWHLVRSKKGLYRELIWDFTGSLPSGLPQCDVLIHLAAKANFGQELEYIQYQVNTLSTIKLAAYAKENKIYFIFASMASIHGSQCELVDYNSPLNPDTNYSLSKYLAEEVIKTFTDCYSILRISGVYGLDGPGHLGLNKAITDALYMHKRPTLKGSGNVKRNYICVQDVAKWIIKLIDTYYYENYRNITAKKKEILYLSGNETMTILDYLQHIVDILLPGQFIEKIEGATSHDFIVQPSPAPFKLIKFKEYLKQILR